MGKLNMEAIQAARQRLERQGSNTQWDKLQNGKNIRRILWPKGTRDVCYTEGSYHFGLGEDGKTSMVCRKTANHSNRCPVCDYIAELQKSKDANDKKLAETIKPRRRVYFNVLDRDGENGQEEIKVMAVGVTVQKQIIEVLCNPDYGDITDFETGNDITIKRSGQGLNTEYSVLPKPQKTPASTHMTKEEIEDAMADLDAFWTIPSIEDMEKVLYGEDSEDSDDFEPQTSRGTAKTASNTDDDDELYDMELDDLKALCEERGITLPEKITRLKLITLLKEDEEDAKPDDKSDDVRSAINSALSRKR